MDTNIFGGKNKNGLYTPLTEDEQEVLERLAQAGQYRVVIKDWGFVDRPKVAYGDARLQFVWKMAFSKPEVPMPVHFFELELWTHSGILLLKNKLPVSINGQPLQVAAGLELDMAWDIQLKQIDPAVVKAIKPGSVGLTSRLGNMKMTSEQRQQLQMLRQNEAMLRQLDVQNIQKLAKKATR